MCVCVYVRIWDILYLLYYIYGDYSLNFKYEYHTYLYIKYCMYII